MARAESPSLESEKRFRWRPVGKQSAEKRAKASGQCVETFVSDEWTLEYDLALGPKDASGRFTGGLAEDVFVAACLAAEDDDIHAGSTTKDAVVTTALAEFARLMTTAAATNGCTLEEALASHVYAKFAKDNVSKPVAAQYLSERLQDRFADGALTVADLRSRLPRYLSVAIDYVSGSMVGTEPRTK